MRPHSANQKPVRRQSFGRLASDLRARTLRLSDGRVVLVRGQPDPHRLLDNLAHAGVMKSDKLAPRQLGFTEDLTEPLTAGLLARVAHRVRRRERWVERQRHGVTRRQAAELRRVRRRLDYLYGHYNQPTTSENGFGLLIDEEQQAELDALVHSAGCHQPGDAELPRFTRIVFWLSGRSAAERFMQAYRRLPPTSRESRARDQLRSTLAQLQVWRRRLAVEPLRGIRMEVEEWARRLPADLAMRAGLLGKKFRRSLPSRLQAQVEACRQAVNECSDGCRSTQLAAVAALVACDQHAAPDALAAEWGASVNGHRVQRSAAMLLDELTKPGFGRLVDFLERHSGTSCWHYESIRTQLARGEREEDVRWALDHNLGDRVGDAGLRTRWFRRLVEDTESAGLEMTSKVDLFADACQHPRARSVIRGYVDWVIRLPADARSPRVVRQLKSTLAGPMLWAVDQPETLAAVEDWLQAAAIPRGASVDDLGVWHCVAEACGAGHARTAVEAGGDASARELAYLHSLATSGRASQPQLVRLEILTRRRDAAARLPERGAKAVCRAAVSTANQALLRGLRDASEGLLGAELAELIKDEPLSRCLEFTSWRSDMDATQRLLLQEVLAKHARHGPGYKLHVDCNQAWIRAARAEGVRVRRWLRPPGAAFGHSAGWARVAVANGLLDVLLMGTRFQTCLSLDGCNKLAVLTNAAHANKQVVYAYDEHGRPIARKLLAISKQGTLLGYECFVMGVGESQRDEVMAAVEDYCIQLAHAANVALADRGEPASLSGCFWYDDLPVPWTRLLPSDPSLLGRACGYAGGPAPVAAQ